MQEASDNRTRLDLTQFCHFKPFTDKENNRYRTNVIKYALEGDFDVNSIFSIDGTIEGNTTALHQAFERSKDIELFEILLNRRADFTIKDGKALTIVHAIVRAQGLLDSVHWVKLRCDLVFINKVLSAHVTFANSANPKSEAGLSHFHAACVVNHIEAVEFFLKNGVSVNDRVVSEDSSQYSGYTPLHFAAKCTSLETAQLLLAYGANWYATCAQGLTPIHILLQKRIELCEKLQKVSLHDRERKKAMEEIQENEKMLKLVVESGISLITGLSTFHVACTLKDSSVAESLFEHVTDIDHAVSDTSLIFPNYTALHFAARCNIDTVKFLVEKGANGSNENGKAALDLCIERYDLIDLVHYLLENHPRWKSIVFSDGKTKLSDVVFSMRSASEFSEFLTENNGNINMYIPTDSSLWPGCTLLHLAVILSKEHYMNNGDYVVKLLLKFRIIINLQNHRGRTAIHVAFRQRKRYLVELLLESLTSNKHNIVDRVDEQNLSYLHIACALNIERFALKINTSNSSISYGGKTPIGLVMPGYTPLHIAVWQKNVTIVKSLVEHGANVDAPDMKGMTPIHLLALYPEIRCDIVDFLFASSNLQNCTVPQCGLSYLHVASLFGNVEALTNLIELGVEACPILSSEPQSEVPCKTSPSSLLARHVSHTPIHFALSSRYFSVELVNLLIHHSVTQLIEIFDEKFLKDNTLKNFMITLKCNSRALKCMEERLGLSMLHVACYLADVKLVKELLNQAVDVNVRINSDSSMYSQFTPLHMCARHNGIVHLHGTDMDPIITLLLEHGADVTLVDSKGETPIHAYYNNNTQHLSDRQCKILGQMLRSQRDFNVNPTNDGISHFHVACQLNDLEAIEKYLEYAPINVNQPISYFSKNSVAKGCTPLHLSLICKSQISLTQLLQVIELLFNYGSEVHAKDINGDTPLHMATSNKFLRTKTLRLEIIDKLLAHGGCINTENYEGVTPFEMLLSHSITTGDIKFLMERGCRVNTFNRFTGEGYIGQFIGLCNSATSGQPILTEIYRLFETSAGERDRFDRIAVQAIFAASSPVRLSDEEYHQLVYSILTGSYDIDHQDHSGKTALHHALLHGNKKAVALLLQAGADVNIIDNSGKLAVWYSENRCTQRSIHEICDCSRCEPSRLLLEHVENLKKLGLEVNEAYNNMDISKFGGRQNHWLDHWPATGSDFSTEVERIKVIDVGVHSLIIHGFLSETGAVTLFPYLTLNEQEAIKNFINSISPVGFRKIYGILKLQLNKAVSRLRLVNEAATVLRQHLGFSLPGLCEEIMKYLSNGDLKTLISSENGNEM